MQKFTLKYVYIAILFTALISCMNDDQWMEDQTQGSGSVIPEKGVFIINEGNFMYGNASLSFFDPQKHEVKNNLFYSINTLPLGDVAQSMAIFQGKGYIAVNNSGRIYIIDIHSGKYIGKITGLTSPRYIHFVNSTKAYITDLYSGEITIYNPSNNSITGTIKTGGHQSTENIVQNGKLIYISCWVADNTILVIDSETDTIIDEIKTAIQPSAMRIDSNNKLWVVCDGGISNNRRPAIQRINLQDNVIDKTFEFSGTSQPTRLEIDNTNTELYFINKDVYRLSVNADELPPAPLIPSNGIPFYSLGIDPATNDIYVSDAIDFMQKGLIYRYNKAGELQESFKAGIIPGYFCFKQ